MQIIINTEVPLSDEDRAVLALLAGNPVAAAAPAAAAAAPAAAPKKRAAAKPAPAPAPEPEDEPEDEDEDEDVVGGTAPTMGDAVARATELVGAGEASRVKAALADLGVKKVSELKGADDIAAFVEALED